MELVIDIRNGHLADAQRLGFGLRGFGLEGNEAVVDNKGAIRGLDGRVLDLGCIGFGRLGLDGRKLDDRGEHELRQVGHGHLGLGLGHLGHELGRPRVGAGDVA